MLQRAHSVATPVCSVNFHLFVHAGLERRKLEAFAQTLESDRRENPALQTNMTIKFHRTSNDEILCFSKTSADGTNIVITVVSVDPHNTQSGWVELDLAALGVDSARPFQVHGLITNARHSWTGGRNFVQLNPNVIPAHIFRIRRRIRTERDFEYYL